MSHRTAKDIILTLALEPHPEGGWYRQTFADDDQAGQRPQSTAIYYLLEQQQVSHWHRVDAVELWHYYAGAPLQLSLSDGTRVKTSVLGADLAAGQLPQCVVRRQAWQSARSLGEWTLVGCTVAPGFQFSGFELAPAGWQPENR